MKDRQLLQRYINDFRRHLAPYLRPSIGLSCVAYPALQSGALLEFTIGPGIANEDHIKEPFPTVNDALASIKQRAFGGSLSGFHFGGTNVVMEDNRIILIKGEDAPDHWSDKGALEDVKRIVVRPTSAGAQR